jgi:hypothetical protein
MDGLQERIHQIQQQHPTWAAFKEALKSTYSMEDTSKAARRGFEDWVETPKRGIKVLEVFTVFEEKFGRLSAQDQTILMLHKWLCSYRRWMPGIVTILGYYRKTRLWKVVSRETGIMSGVV